MEYDMEERKESEEKQKQSQVPDENQANLTFKDLYKRIDDEYLKIRSEYDIAEKSKKSENKEVRAGCLILTIMAAAAAAVIFTPLPWYWAGIGLLIIITLLGSRIKEWNLEYAKDFLRRMEEEKQKDPAMFVFTLRKWVDNLPKNDRAKQYFESVVGNMPMPDLEYQWQQEAPDQLPTPASTPEYKPQEQETREPAEDRVYCPRCGSDWIRYEEKDPGKVIYVCESCSKKWRPERS